MRASGRGKVEGRHRPAVCGQRGGFPAIAATGNEGGAGLGVRGDETGKILWNAAGVPGCLACLKAFAPEIWVFRPLMAGFFVAVHGHVRGVGREG